MAKENKLTPKEFFAKLAENKDFIFAIGHTNSFKKDVKLCYKQNLDLNELYSIIEKLAKAQPLEAKNRLHSLTNFAPVDEGEIIRECHVANDWVLIWVENKSELVLIFTDTGSHAHALGM
ncbi:MAG: type II toxin-antitoxin system YafQ family toxin [Bacteroidetes bacterium]|nr:type II toxin-antitoxin system YafQ family toxin [Bacteroidota bacterium]